jgi:hypothetical protein
MQKDNLEVIQLQNGDAAKRFGAYSITPVILNLKLHFPNILGLLQTMKRKYTIQYRKDKNKISEID